MTSRAVFLGDDERVTSARNAGETLHLHRSRRSRSRYRVAVFVSHGSHSAVGGAGDDGITNAQGSRLDEHGRNRATTLVELGFNRDTARILVRVGAQVETGVSGEQYGVEQFGDADSVASRDVDEHRVAAVLLGDQAELGELLAHLVRIGVWLVNLVDRDHNRHAGRLCVVERFNRLRHDAIVCGNHENRDVGDLSTTSTHGGERLVTGGVNEGNRTVDTLVHGVHLVGTDVLGDATGLTGNNVGVTNRVEQPGLTVIDVAHHGYHRRANLKVFVGLVFKLSLEVDVKAVKQLFVFILGRNDLNLEAELGAEHLEGGLVERLGRGRHFTEVEQHRDQACRVSVNLVGKVGKRCAATQPDDRVAVAAGNTHATK